MSERGPRPTGPKVHPAQREWLPDDPMDMHAVELPGSAQVMLEIIVEEFLRLGCGPEVIIAAAGTGEYQALGHLLQSFGGQEFARRVHAVAQRIGTLNVAIVEQPTSCCEDEGCSARPDTVSKET